MQRHRLILLGGLLALDVCIRLIGISQPFADTWSWRQADVAMIAENFHIPPNYVVNVWDGYAEAA